MDLVKPSDWESEWDSDNAYSKLFFCIPGGSGEWVDLTKINDPDHPHLYAADVPEGYSHVIVVRINGSYTGNNYWEAEDNHLLHVWNQTGDIPLDLWNYNFITSFGVKENGNVQGSLVAWDVYTPQSS